MVRYLILTIQLSQTSFDPSLTSFGFRNTLKVQRSKKDLTQEQLAELGSSREVISRILEDFTSQGMILTKRGTIEILQFESLKNQTVV